MERLTKRDGEDNKNAFCPSDVKCCGRCSVCDHMDKMMEKLADYEDAEEQGLLLRLPVPIGTTVYKFEPSVKETKRYIKTIVTRYDVFEDSIWFTFANGLGKNIEDFGKYVFLAREEAEQALKQMGE